MTPLVSWMVLLTFAALGSIFALAVARWLEEDDFDRWEADVQRWNDARDALTPYDHEQENR